MANLLPASSARAHVEGNVHGPGFTGGARPVPEHAGFGGAFDSFVTNSWPGKRTNEVSSVPMQVGGWRRVRVCCPNMCNMYPVGEAVQRPIRDLLQ